MVYECKICGYVYDEEKGDPKNGIAPGTPFSEIREDWTCPICDAPKASCFVEKKTENAL